MTGQNMKRLGDYIRPVDVRNRDLKVTRLMGINIEKRFMPSVANVVGTDLSNYKVVSKGKFACNLMHVGRDEKIPVALQKDDEPIIVSPAYVVFEVVDTNVLLTEYLMMWFSRLEFDRNAWFYTDGDVRGGMDREALFDMKIPVPVIEKQREIVAEYNTLASRIETNKKLIATLEQTAGALYRHTFIDNIDPNNLPQGWRMGTLGEIVECFDSKRKPIAGYDRDKMDLSQKIYPYYGAASLMDYVDDYIFDGSYILMGEDGTVINEDKSPVIQYVKGKFWVNNHAHVLKGKCGFDENLLYLVLKKTKVNEYITGGVQAKINQENMMNIPVLIPKNNIVMQLKIDICPLFELIINKKRENEKLTELQSLLLAKMGK